MELARSSIADEASLVELGAHHLRGIEDPVSIVQVTSSSLPSDFPPLRTIEASAATVPRTDSTFFGRDTDLETVAGLIESHRLVTIVGAGGCGKTRLAIEVVRDQLDRFRDGAVWVDLAPVTSADGVLDAAATAIGMRGSTEPTLPRVVARLAGRSMLVVVDNCEHLIDEAAAFVSAVHGSGPDVRVLTTSREPLALKDETVWRVPSLSLPHEADGADLADSDAGRMLVDRIRRFRPGFEPAGDQATLAQICRRLDGIPLAIELAAARTAMIPPAALWQRLEDRFSLLTGGGRDVLARQRTLEASVAWSYQLLSDAEQHAFRRLSVFNGSFPVAAGAAVVGGDPDRAEELVLRLLDCSLLTDRSIGGEPRMQMLETIRWFARERLLETGDGDDAKARLLDWCVELARRWGRGLEGRGVRDAVRRARTRHRELPRRHELGAPAQPGGGCRSRHLCDAVVLDLALPRPRVG